EAAYMVARTLWSVDGDYKQRSLEAYQQIDSILADPSLKRVHGIARNYRFILMSDLIGSYGEVADAKNLEQHFRWLLSLVEQGPVKEDDLDRDYQDIADAWQQLAIFFPRGNDG